MVGLTRAINAGSTFCGAQEWVLTGGRTAAEKKPSERPRIVAGATAA